MTYQPRIIVDPEYLQALGQAVYNFTFLEGIVIWTIVKLSPDGFNSVPKGETALTIAKALTKAIANALPPLPNSLRLSLIKFDKSYRDAIPLRNKLLHAHPHTALDGAQQLGGEGYAWPIDTVHDAAKFFEEAAMLGNDIFHGDLAKARP